ncbi:hypothetical protein [uncultured Bradyrhizobium sp.]|uniref:hypothetical protein n=1 Tax=uncultured Bradyrhizobium sp. TaxID=199684 RepID=UPI0035CB034F
MLTDRHIALMCDVADSGAADISPEHLNEMLDLIADDYVESDDSTNARYRLTAKGRKLLEDRAVEANKREA